MVGIPHFLKSKSQLKREREYEKRKAEEMLGKAIPFDPKFKWQKEVCFDANSYNAWLKKFFLFPDLEAVTPKTMDPLDGPHIASPSGDLVYVHRTFPKATRLGTVYGKHTGSVWFTGPVTFPVLLRRRQGHMELRDENVWMSLTPFEVFSLRGGTRYAKGHTVIAGLGLGYQLIQVCKRKKVKRVTLVEIEKELVDWLLPVIRPHLNGMNVKVVIGDARKLVPKMTADSALIDIDAGYGGNYIAECPKIGHVWVWGSTYAD